MEVWVDEALCDGCEICIEICPELFEKKWEVALANAREVPEEWEEHCMEAAETCPTGAIIIED